MSYFLSEIEDTKGYISFLEIGNFFSSNNTKSTNSWLALKYFQRVFSIIAKKISENKLNNELNIYALCDHEEFLQAVSYIIQCSDCDGTQGELSKSLIKNVACIYYYKGKLHFENNNIDLASSCYEQALKFDKDLLEARYLLGYCWLRLQKYSSAFEAFKECVKFNYQNRLLFGNNIKIYEKLIQAEDCCKKGKYSNAAYNVLQAMIDFQQLYSVEQIGKFYSKEMYAFKCYLSRILHVKGAKEKIINDINEVIARKNGLFNFQPEYLLIMPWEQSAPGGLLCYLGALSKLKLFKINSNLNLTSNLLKKIFNSKLVKKVKYVNLDFFNPNNFILLGKKRMDAIVKRLQNSPLEILHIKNCKFTSTSYLNITRLLLNNPNVRELVLDLSVFEHSNVKVGEDIIENFIVKILQITNNPRFSLRKFSNSNIHHISSFFINKKFWKDRLYDLYKNKRCKVNLEDCKFTDSKDKKEYRKLYNHNRKMHKAKIELSANLFAKTKFKKRKLVDISIECKSATKLLSFH